MRSLFSLTRSRLRWQRRYGTQVHNQVSDTTSRQMTTIYRCKFDAFSFGYRYN